MHFLLWIYWVSKSCLELFNLKHIVKWAKSYFLWFFKILQQMFSSALYYLCSLTMLAWQLFERNYRQEHPAVPLLRWELCLPIPLLTPYKMCREGEAEDDAGRNDTRAHHVGVVTGRDIHGDIRVLHLPYNAIATHLLQIWSLECHCDEDMKCLSKWVVIH